MITRDQLKAGETYLYQKESFRVDYVGKMGVILTGPTRERTWDIEDCLRLLTIPPKPKKQITLHWWANKNGEVLVSFDNAVLIIKKGETYRIIKTEFIEVDE